MKKILLSLAFLLSLTAQAQLSSGLNAVDRDETVKPGDDFYRYTTGGWRDSHPLTPEYSRYGQFNVLAENNEQRLHDIITNLADAQQTQGSLEQKIGSLYKLAMDSVRRNNEGAAPVISRLERVNCCETKADLWCLIGEYDRIGVGTVVAFGNGADEKNASQNIVCVGQPGLTLGERDYYLENDSATTKIRDAYRTYLTKLFQLVGDAPELATEKMQTILKIETAMAEKNFSAVQRRDPEANYHKMSYARLLNDFNGLDWSTLFLNAGYPSFKEVNVAQIEPVHNAEKLWKECSLDELKTYTEFRVLRQASGYLSDDFRSLNFEFFNKTMQGAQQDKARWKRSVGLVENVLGEAVGKMYAEKYFPAAAKERMLQLVKNLQVALGERIEAQTWMSAETKKKALDKLATFYVKIGYPDKWTDFSKLNIDESLSLYENICNANLWASTKDIDEKVNKPVDKDEWFMYPQTINAYYNPTTNEICFPAGILQPPFFNMDADDAANYGAIGVVIGHEMTHGFDDQGAQFDKDGNLNNWWTEEDLKNFKQRTDKLAAFFDKQEVLPGMNANGRLTLGENMADHGGLMVAYQAFQNALKTNPLGTKDGYTPDQRFFLSYGVIWASNAREEALRQLNRSDPHSTPRLRVNGTLPHIDAWYKAFNVKKGNKLFLNKKDRVECW